ncbi:MAG: hypothetical protein II136_05320, partial [Prevotella sp.]|nr:hypothetical protein [Prevotella sp.]
NGANLRIGDSGISCPRVDMFGIYVDLIICCFLWRCLSIAVWGAKLVVFFHFAFFLPYFLTVRGASATIVGGSA